MKRVIKNFASLDDDLRLLLNQKYPHGIQKGDLLSFPTPKGKRLYGVELTVGETSYLVHIPHALALLENGRGPQLDYDWLARGAPEE